MFERYYRMMFGVCLRYVSDQDAVQDIVQEGFLKIFSNIEGYTFKGSFEGWMRRIMVNTSIDAIRRRKAAGMVLGDEKSFEDVAEEEDYSYDDEEEVVYTVNDVQEAMSSLSPMYRAVFNMYVFDNMKHHEIAAHLGITVGTSKSNLAKARRNLRVLLIKKKSGNV